MTAVIGPSDSMSQRRKTAFPDQTFGVFPLTSARAGLPAVMVDAGDRQQKDIPLDVTVSELAIESSFPASDETAVFLRHMAGT